MDAIPWYKSKVYVGAVVTLLSTLITLWPKLGTVLGLGDPTAVETLVQNIFGVIAALAAAGTLAARHTSTIQPVTLTQAAADAHPNNIANANDPTRPNGFASVQLLAIIAALTAVLALTSCAALGVPNADTFNKKVAVAYSTVTSVRTGAVTLLEAGSISADDAQDVQNQADNARATIDAAITLHKTNATAGEDKLTVAVNALTLLQQYIASKKAGSSP